MSLVKVKVLICFILATLTVGSQLEPSLSFFPPFKTVDFHGERIVDKFRSSDSTVVKEYFIRLTPDRQSKVGKIWSENRVVAPNGWSAMIRFRVSGQGKSLFGDGFAFWFTNMQTPSAGQLYGVDDAFSGFAVIFDTFKNTETGHWHKDISLLTGDGSPSIARKDQERPGCDAAFRFHEKRADFDVQQTALAKITVQGGILTVQVDAKGDGMWVNCFTSTSALEGLTSPRGEAGNAYIGISASTGQLADNHDILALNFHTLQDQDTPDSMTIQMADEIKNNGQVVELAGEAAVVEYAEGRLQTDELGQAVTVVMDREKKKMFKRLEEMNHKLEHQLTSVTDALQNAIDKLRKQEEDAEARIDELEARLKGKLLDLVDNHVQTVLVEKVESVVADKVEKVEESLNGRLLETTEQVVDSIQKDVAESLKEHTQVTNEAIEEVASSAKKYVVDVVEETALVQGGNGGWRLPFAMLFFIFLAGGAFVAYKYKELRKNHLL